ncbi:MAG: hypothetical protein F6K28_00340 [Microcoleus sp. SIO2G3]|nr:hypothetical protein [Microcoleus sp. SIO2G3]
MKRLVLGGLSVLLMSATAAPGLRAEVVAETTPVNVSQTQATNVPQSTLTDREYLNAVNSELEDLTSDD